MKGLDTGETDDNDNMVAKAIAIVAAIKSTKQQRKLFHEYTNERTKQNPQTLRNKDEHNSSQETKQMFETLTLNHNYNCRNQTIA